MPRDIDEMQADVSLVYEVAAPAYLATPPLFTCAASGAVSGGWARQTFHQSCHWHSRRDISVIVATGRQQRRPVQVLMPPNLPLAFSTWEVAAPAYLAT